MSSNKKPFFFIFHWLAGANIKKEDIAFDLVCFKNLLLFTNHFSCQIILKLFLIFLIPWIYDFFLNLPQSFNNFVLFNTYQLYIEIEVGSNSFKIISSLKGQFNPDDKQFQPPKILLLYGQFVA